MRLTADHVAAYFGSQGVQGTKALATLGQIEPKMLATHRKNYPDMPGGTPLLAFNRGAMFSMPFTGFLITDQQIGFKTLKDGVLTSVTRAKGRVEVMPLCDVRSFQIGDHDHCLGTAYVGHQLLINGENMGLVRAGTGVVYDDKAIAGVNGFAQFLFEKGVVDSAPKTFAWQ